MPSETMDPEVKARFDHIDRAIADLTTALTGNKAMGHRGIVERLDTLELLNAEVPGVHSEMEERNKRARGDIHDRVDEVRAQYAELEKQWARFKAFSAGIAVGAGILGGGVGAWVINWLPG